MSNVFFDWGDPIKIMTIDAFNKDEFVVKGLGGARNVKLEIFGLEHNSGTPDLDVTVSSDNGQNWLSTGEYGRAGASTGTARFPIETGCVAQPDSHSGRIEFNSFNQARRSMVRINGGTTNNSTSGRQTALGYQVNPYPLNAVRLRWSTGTPITAARGGYVAAYARNSYPWQEPVDIRTGVSAADVVFDNLDSYRMVLCEVFGVTHGSGTPNFECLISLDNGLNWLGASEYGRYGVNEGNLSWVLVNDAAVSPATHYARIEINNVNLSLRSMARIGGGQSNTAASQQTAPGVQVNEGVITAIKFQWSTGTNITAGDFFLYGVR